MNNVTHTGKAKVSIYVITILATFLLMAFLVGQMIHYTKPAPVGAERAAARAKDNKDIRTAGTEALNNYGYADQAKGIVRLPIDEAMKLTVQGYKQSGSFRSNLLARVEKANAAPPKPPEQPNKYE